MYTAQEEETQQRAEVFATWVEEYNIEAPKLKVLATPIGLGLEAVEDIGAGDDLVKLPLTSIVTQDVAEASPLGQAVLAAWEDAGLYTGLEGEKEEEEEDEDDGGGRVGSDSAVKTASARRLVLYLFMIEAKVLRTSEFTPYFDLLPAEIACTPLTYPEDDSAVAILQGTNIARSVRALRRALAALVATHVAPFPDLLDPEIYHYDSVLWAYSAFWTRCFGIGFRNPATGEEGRYPGLVPMADFLNHNPTTSVEYITSVTDGFFVLRSQSDFAAGSEVWSNYGDAKGNDKLLLSYGFGVRDNTEDAYYVQLKGGSPDGHYLTARTPLPDALIVDAQAIVAENNRLSALTHLTSLLVQRKLDTGTTAADDTHTLDQQGPDLPFNVHHALIYRQGQVRILEAAIQAAIAQATLVVEERGCSDIEPVFPMRPPQEQESSTAEWDAWAASVGIQLGDQVEGQGVLRVPHEMVLSRPQIRVWASQIQDDSVLRALADAEDLDERVVLALCLIHARMTPHAPLHAFASALPPEYASPLFVSPEVRGLAQETALFAGMISLMKELHGEYTQALASLGPEFDPEVFHWQRYLWAASAVAFHATSIQGHLCFLPIHPSRIAYAPGADGFCVSSPQAGIVMYPMGRALPSGIIPIPTAPLPDGGSNGELALKYGAAVVNNPQERLVVTLADDQGDQIDLTLSVTQSKAAHVAAVANTLGFESDMEAGQEGYQILIHVLHDFQTIASALSEQATACFADRAFAVWIDSQIAVVTTLLKSFK